VNLICLVCREETKREATERLANLLDLAGVSVTASSACGKLGAPTPSGVGT